MKEYTAKMLIMFLLITGIYIFQGK